jgi:hypothetical protein
MFWDVRNVESDSLPAPTSHDPTDPRWTDTHLSRRYLVTDGSPDQVSMRVRLRPVGLDLIADLEDSGDLEPGYAEMIPTFDLANSLKNWSIEDGYDCGN